MKFDWNPGILESWNPFIAIHIFKPTRTVQYSKKKLRRLRPAQVPPFISTVKTKPEFPSSPSLKPGRKRRKRKKKTSCRPSHHQQHRKTITTYKERPQIPKKYTGTREKKTRKKRSEPGSVRSDENASAENRTRGPSKLKNCSTEKSLATMDFTIKPLTRLVTRPGKILSIDDAKAAYYAL